MEETTDAGARMEGNETNVYQLLLDQIQDSKLSTKDASFFTTAVSKLRDENGKRRLELRDVEAERDRYKAEAEKLTGEKAKFEETLTSAKEEAETYKAERDTVIDARKAELLERIPDETKREAVKDFSLEQLAVVVDFLPPTQPPGSQGTGAVSEGVNYETLKASEMSDEMMTKLRQENPALYQQKLSEMLTRPANGSAGFAHVHNG